MLVGTALVGSGIEWPKMTIRGTNTHVFAVGDWGGLAGTLPHNSQIIQYKGGDQGLWWLEWFTEFTVCSNNFFGGRNMCQSQGIWKHRKLLEVTIQLLLNSKKLWTWGTIIPIQDIPPLIQSSDFFLMLLDGMKTPGRWTNDGSPHHGEISNQCQNPWFVLYHPCTLDFAKSSFF